MRSGSSTAWLVADARGEEAEQWTALVTRDLEHVPPLAVPAGHVDLEAAGEACARRMLDRTCAQAIEGDAAAVEVLARA